MLKDIFLQMSEKTRFAHFFNKVGVSNSKAKWLERTVPDIWGCCLTVERGIGEKHVWGEEIGCVPRKKMLS